MHSSCSPPPSRRVILLFLYHIVSLVPEVTTHYHTRRHGASPSLNCFPSFAEGRGQERPPCGTLTARSCRRSSAQVRERRRRVFPLFAREFCRESARGNGGEKKARQFTSGHRGRASNSSLLSARYPSYSAMFDIKGSMAGRTFRALMAVSKNEGKGMRSLIGVYGRKISFFSVVR